MIRIKKKELVNLSAQALMFIKKAREAKKKEIIDQQRGRKFYFFGRLETDEEVWNRLEAGFYWETHLLYASDEAELARLHRAFDTVDRHSYDAYVSVDIHTGNLLAKYKQLMEKKENERGD